MGCSGSSCFHLWCPCPRSASGCAGCCRNHLLLPVIRCVHHIIQPGRYTSPPEANYCTRRDSFPPLFQYYRHILFQKSRLIAATQGIFSTLWSVVSISVPFLPPCSRPLSSSLRSQHWQQCNLNCFSQGPNRLLPAHRICSYWLVIRL